MIQQLYCWVCIQRNWNQKFTEISVLIVFEHSLALPFFGTGMKTDLFHSWAPAEFSKFAGILSAALSQHHLRIWNSSTGIPLPPVDLFVVMLPKAHLTSHSRMSGSRWVIPSLWLSGLWRSFLYSSSVYSCHLFLISSASSRSIPFLSFIDGLVIFPDEISPEPVPISPFPKPGSLLHHPVFFLLLFFQLLPLLLLDLIRCQHLSSQFPLRLKLPRVVFVMYSDTRPSLIQTTRGIIPVL